MDAPDEGSTPLPTTKFVAPANAQDSPVTPIPVVATELASGSTFSTADDGERLVGFPLVRPDEVSFPVVSQRGIVETFPEVGLPRARQVVVVPSHQTTLQITQEPTAYPQSTPTADVDVSEMTVGMFEGRLEVLRDQICLTFLSGAT